MQHVIFFFAILLSFPFRDKFRNKYIPFYAFSFLILFLFAALRYNYGNDYMVYYNAHLLIKYGSSGFFEPGFEILLRSFKSFFTFVALHSFVHIFTYYLLIRTFVEIRYYWLALSIFILNPNIFLIELSAMRQTISICLVILSVYLNVKYNNKFLSSLPIILAPFFHISAVAVLPVFLLLPRKNSYWYKVAVFLMVSLLILSLFTWFLQTFFDINFDIIARLLSIVTQEFELFEKYTVYAQSSRRNLATVFLTYGSFGFLTLFVLRRTNDQRTLLFGYLFLIGNLLYVLTTFHYQFSRLAFYFEPFGIVFLSRLLSLNLSKPTKYGIVTYVLAVYAYKYVMFFQEPVWRPFVHYNTILSVIRY